MSLLQSNFVYQGFWIDRSKGSVLGALITTDSTSANIIVAVVSTLVAVCGLQFWGLIAFAFYALRTSSEPKSGLHHQQQLLLRNTSSPGGFMIEFIKLGWYWRNSRAKYTILKSLICAFIAFSCLAGFLVAGIFSSRVVSSGSIEVLVHSPGCGLWNEASTDSGSPNAYQARQSWVNGGIEKALQFSRTCYNTTEERENDPACKFYTTSTLPVASDTFVDCPFADMCRTDNNLNESAIRIDTGPMDSAKFFGINAAADDGITVRKVSTCGLLNTDNYTYVNNNHSFFNSLAGREPLPNEGIYVLNYGDTLGLSNFTMGISTNRLNVTPDYTSSWASYWPDGTATDFGIWRPIPSLIRSDADTAIMYIAMNAVRFEEPCDDPLFSAHTNLSIVNADDSMLYTADKPVGVVGCAEQYQVCNPANGKCTALTASYFAFEEVDSQGVNPLELSPKQNATLQLFKWQIFLKAALDITAASTRNPPALLAPQNMHSGFQYPLPGNQWEIEVHGWMYLVLSAWQYFMADYAVGPGATDPSWSPYIDSTTNDTGMHWLCGAQKRIAPAGFANVSVFGLSFIVAICGIIIFSNLTVVPLARLIGRLCKKSFRSLEHWKEDGILQVQKRAYESIGVTSWKPGNGDVPVILGDQRLARLHSVVSTESRLTDASSEVTKTEKPAEFTIDEHAHSTAS